MELIKVTRKSPKYNDIKRLYLQAFPKEERAPFGMLMRKANAADFFALYDNTKWIGLAYIVRREQLAYIFYIAVTPEQRGKGYGTAAMKALIEYYKGCRLFLALEQLDKSAENYEQRIKRHEFYKKCGLSDLPYKIKEGGVVYDIMGVGGKVEPEEYRELIDNYLGWFMKRVVDMRIIKE